MHGMYNGSYITCTLEKEHQSQGILSPTFATDKHLKGDQSQELYSIRVKKKIRILFLTLFAEYKMVRVKNPHSINTNENDYFTVPHKYTTSEVSLLI